MRRTTALLVTVGVLTAAGAAPAAATIRERFTLHEEWSHAEDCGFPVEVTGWRDDLFLVREGTNQDAGAFPVVNRTSWSETWTNPETGDWFTISGRSLFNEVSATRVEGSIFEFRAVDAGQPFVVVDSDGTVVERNSGSVHFSYLFDTGGDDEPGGEWLADTDFWVAGPHPSLDLAPCDYAVQLIG
ncbi:hypothetical protein [Nocardioides taihuensis]